MDLDAVQPHDYAIVIVQTEVHVLDRIGARQIETQTRVHRLRSDRYDGVQQVLGPGTRFVPDAVVPGRPRRIVESRDDPTEAEAGIRTVGQITHRREPIDHDDFGARVFGDQELIQASPVSVVIGTGRTGRTLRIGVGKARIADIAEPITVTIRLIEVGVERAVVDVAASVVPVDVVERVVGAEVAHVPRPIAIAIRLAWIGHERAVVDGTNVAGVAWIAESVAIGVGAGVAGVAQAVVVGVELRRVVHGRAVVLAIAHTVEIDVVEGVVGAHVASIAHAIAIAVFLPGVSHLWTVVGGAGIGGIAGIPEGVHIAIRARVAGVSGPVPV